MSSTNNQTYNYISPLFFFYSNAAEQEYKIIKSIKLNVNKLSICMCENT